MGSHRGVTIGDQLVGKVIHQGTEVQAVHGCMSAQKGDFSELICSTKKLSCSDARGGNTLGVKGVQPLGNTLSSSRGQSESGPREFDYSKSDPTRPDVRQQGAVYSRKKWGTPIGGNQRGGVGAVPALLTATKCPFSNLKCTSKGLSSLDANGGNMGQPSRVDIGAENVANPMGKSWIQVVNNNVQHKGFTLAYVASCVKEDKVVVEPPLEAASNGLQATKHHQSQGVSATTTFNGSLTNKYHHSQKVATIAKVNGSHINKYHHAHGVSATHIQYPAAIRNFEDGEVYASTPIAALHNSPSRLTWADQASSEEFIPKEALDLEEEYGGFSVNSDFLIESVNQSTEEGVNRGSNTGGAKQGEFCTRSKPATIKKCNPSNQAQQSRSSTAAKVTVQPTTPTETIQSITQHAAPTGGGTLTHSHYASSIGLRGLGDQILSQKLRLLIHFLPDMDPPLLLKAIATQRAAPTDGGTLTHSHLASSKELRGTGPLTSLPEITPAIVSQEERFTDAPMTGGHSSDIDSCAVNVNP
ncbi:hypothetical protein F0562_032170 [Nyssa sinensis]|uniref:Uncharacterized protein n=1 Tax=Nyssa sinensis TaxID=561372 RepID=A0A5J5AUR0_9ASTE|nr:hypothetical protein F0562_032170 [Nyssa sinensis]